MPSAIAAIPLTVQGVDVQRADLSLFLEVAEGLGAGASVRGGDVLVPGLPGQRSRNRIQNVLSLELAGWIKAASLAAYRDLVQEVNLLFRPSRGPVELSATLEDGTVVTIPARAEFPFSWGDEVGPTRRVRIGLEATDPPYWRGAEVVDLSRAIASSPTDFVLANPGTERTHEIVLELVGPITNPRITNQTNGVYVELLVSVAGGQTAIIDGKAFTALRGATNDIGSIRHSGARQWMLLEPGNNSIRVTRTAGTGTLTTRFRPVYL
jgi:hypothetical protein